MRNADRLLVCLPPLLAVVVLFWPVTYPEVASQSQHARLTIVAAQLITVAYCVVQFRLPRFARLGFVSASATTLLFAGFLKHSDYADHRQKWHEVYVAVEKIDRQMAAGE